MGYELQLGDCCPTEQEKKMPICETAYRTTEILTDAIRELDILITTITGETPMPDEERVPKCFRDNIDENAYLANMIRLKVARLKEVF